MSHPILKIEESTYLVCLFVCLEFNAAFNSFGHITAVSAPTHVFLAFSTYQYLHNILSKPLTTFSHRSEVRGDGKIARKNVAATGYRTRDLQITCQIRYQLSYPAEPLLIWNSALKRVKRLNMIFRKAVNSRAFLDVFTVANKE